MSLIIPPMNSAEGSTSDLEKYNSDLENLAKAEGYI